MVTVPIAAVINQVLSELHALSVIHMDLEELNAYPHFAFRNIFIHVDSRTGQQGESSWLFPAFVFWKVLILKPKMPSSSTSIAQKSHPIQQNLRKRLIEWLKCSNVACRATIQDSTSRKKLENFGDTQYEQTRRSWGAVSYWFVEVRSTPMKLSFVITTTVASSIQCQRF